MSQTAIGLLFVERVAADRFKLIKVIFATIVLRHLGVPLAEVAGAISMLSQDIGVQRLDCIGPRLIGIAGRAVAASHQSRQNGCATDPADRMADEHVLKADAAPSQ